MSHVTTHVVAHIYLAIVKLVVGYKSTAVDRPRPGDEDGKRGRGLGSQSLHGTRDVELVLRRQPQDARGRAEAVLVSGYHAELVRYPRLEALDVDLFEVTPRGVDNALAVRAGLTVEDGVASDRLYARCRW